MWLTGVFGYAGSYIMMQWLITWPAFEAIAHQIAVEEDSGSAQGRLRQLEHHAHLQDEIDAFAAQCALFVRRHAVNNGGRQE